LAKSDVKTFFNLSRCAAVFGSLSLLFATSGWSAGTQVLRECVLKTVPLLQPTGRLAGTNRLNLAIGLPLRNRETLTNLLRQIYDPACPNYRHYLTPEQFAQRFGPTEKDYQAVIAFAQAKGLTVTATHPNRMLVDVNGSVAHIEKALQVTMRTYQHPRENRTFFAPDTEPSLDLAVSVLSISGLNDYSLPRPRLQAAVLANAAKSLSNAGSGPGGTFMGKDFRAAYVPDSPLDGSGQTVGLLQFDGYMASDITYYASRAGLPSITLSNVLIDGASGLPSGGGGDLEVPLDIEMAMSMATNLSKVVVYVAPNPSPWEDLLNRMANDNLAKQLSCSWYQSGGGADPTADQIFQQMAAQGQSFFNASGDSDAFTGLIGFPGDTPYITQVGGTTLTTTGPGGSWVSETVWNWGNGIGSGGGISTQYPIPTWQTNIDMTANQGSTTKRNTPDVALTADQVYVRAGGGDYNVGGTSCAAPLWAGFAALVNQQAAANGKPAVGFINPLVDIIGSGANYASAFHDITTGNNTSGSSPTNFYAVSGYDLCTGWGTPAGQSLINALLDPEGMVITPSSGFTSIGPVSGPFTITSQSLSLANIKTDSLTWTLVNTSLWLNASPSGGTLTPTEPATTVTVSLNTAASNLVVGTYSATVWFTNLNSGAGQGRQFTLSIFDRLQITPAIGFTALGPVGGPFKITSQDFSLTNLGTASLNWSLVNTSLWLDASPSSGTLNGGTSATVTVSLTAAAYTNSFGVYTASIWFTSGDDYIGQECQFTLNIGRLPVITVEPTNQTVVVGGTATFGVLVSSTGSCTYRWQLNGTNLPDNIINTVVGNGTTNYFGDGGVATKASLDDPSGVAVDGFGNLFIADTGNSCIRKVDTNGLITTVAGDGSAGYSGDGGAATNASLDGPFGVAVDASGNLFIADIFNNRIREVDTNGIITTVAGTGSAGYSGDGGAATNANLSYPAGVAVDGSGNLFIADLGNSCIRKVDTNGLITTVAGDGSAGYSGDGGAATKASLDDPLGVAVDGSGNLFIADTYNYRIRKVDTEGFITTVAGDGSAGYSGDGGAATNANLREPFGVAVDGSGNLFIADTYNYCIRKVDTEGLITTVAGDGSAGYSGDGRAATNASLSYPAGVAVDGSGNLFIADTGNSRIRKVVVGYPTLTLNNVTPNDAGAYTVIISNAWGSVTSSVAMLTVLSPPVITQQPANQTVAAGGAAGFSVTADGTDLVCQWQKDGTDLADGGILSGSATANLLLSSATPNDAGSYDVVITNQWGSVTSSVVTLTVGSPPAITQQPQSLTVTNGQLAGFSVQVSGTGPLVYQWQFNGNNLTIYDDGIFGQLLQNGYLFSMGNGQQIGNEISVAPSLWSLTNFSIEYYTPDATLSPSVGIDVQFYYNNGLITNGFPSPGTAFYDSGWFYGLPGGGYQVVSYASSDLYSGALPGSMNLPSGFLMPGDFTFSITFTNLNPSNVIDLPLATNVLGTSYGDYWLNDGTGIWTLRSTSVADANLVVDFAGTPAPAGLAALDDGGNVSGSATTNLVLGPANATNAGSYAVIITNQWGSVTSSVVTLTVVSPPFITQQPEGLTVTNGQPAGFSVTVAGTGPLAYQWQFNGNNLTDGGSLSGSATTNLVLSLTTTNDAGSYTVIISNGWGSVTSSVAVLTLASSPVITSQPQSLTVANGDSASFSVAVSALGPFTCQWQKNQTDLADGGNLSGAATTNLFLNPATTNDAGNYTVIITNAWGSVTSSIATLTVGSPPVIISQPQSLTVAAGGFASFNVTASSTPPVSYASYQWNFNGTTISGATNTSLVLSNVQPSQTGAYAVLVTNLFGSILSSNAVLTVSLDHFSWGQIPSPRFVNTPFSVTIQARDMTNGIFTNFTGIASLDSTNGVAVSPALSGNFVQGYWTGAVVISQTATNLVLRAGDGFGHFGIANPINVVALPPLNLQISGNTLLLRWPAGYSGFVLEASGSLSPGAWTVVSVSPIQIGSQYLVPLRLPGTSYFYRLRFSGQ
jgi:sugar lactone lactonase YvrE